MNQTTYSGETLFSAAHPDIVKRTNVSSVLLSIALLVGGIGLFVASFQMEDPSSTVSMLCLTAGCILSLLAVLRLCSKSKEWIYQPTGSALKKDSSLFDESSLNAMADILHKKDFATRRNVCAKPGGAVRLDYFISRDRKFAAAQLFHFIPYTYEPVSSVHYYTDNEAAAFVHCLETGKF